MPRLSTFTAYRQFSIYCGPDMEVTMDAKFWVDAAVKLLAVIVGAWLAYLWKRRLDGLREHGRYRAQVFLPRVAAYRRLWEVMQNTSPTSQEELTPKVREEVATALLTWYYSKGGGLFLSHKAGTSFIHAVRTVRSGSSPEDVRRVCSELRTQLKTDLRVYDKEEADTPLVTAQRAHG